MTTVHDEQLGEILVRRNKKSRAMSATISTSRQLRVTVPALTPMFMVKRMIASSRDQLKQMVAAHRGLVYTDGMSVGKQHTLRRVDGNVVDIKTQGSQLIISLPRDLSLNDNSVTKVLMPQVLKILKKQAKQYLPARLENLANEHGYTYKRVRFSHASTRWGSCSSNGTISLNIALMLLPKELIDYVLVHELAHTKQMNHSKKFWDDVKQMDAQYSQHRTQLKKSHSPHI